MHQEVRGNCPACGEEVDFLYETEHIPYFSEILIISCSCPLCGYRFSDVQSLTVNQPVRFEFRVESESDLMVRVVRSTQGLISIPELGVEISPGPACEGFVSNVEGILMRIDKVLDGVLIDGDDEQRRNIIDLKEKMAMIGCGKFPITIIITDPMGNSLIDSDRAKKEFFDPDDTDI
ncbi:MAG: ZPR1 zinc finger domain-containing protein [Methanobacteriota archaeon]